MRTSPMVASLGLVAVMLALAVPFLNSAKQDREQRFQVYSAGDGEVVEFPVYPSETSIAGRAMIKEDGDRSVTGPMTVLRSDRLKVGDRVICEKFHDGTRGRERFVIIARPVPQSAAVTEEKKLTEYEQYLKLHTQGSRVAQRGNALMINDTTSIKVRGQEVQYDRLDRGSDYCMFVVRYMNESKVGVKGLHNPIVSIKPITRLEGTPKGVVAGDVEIGDYTVHVLSASDEECRYVPIRTIR